MSVITDQLTSISNSKESIRQSIVSKGQVCGKDVPFAGYPPKITAIQTGGVGTEYFKCASVNPTAKIWSGYKAIFSNGVYTFATVAQGGLTYTSVTPVVGSMYSSNALVQVDSFWDGVIPTPTAGLLFYAPLSSNKATAETGQAMTASSSVTFQTFKNIPCANFAGSGGVVSSLDNLLGDSDRSMSIWTYYSGTAGAWQTAIIHGPDLTTRQNFGLYKSENNNLAWSTSGIGLDSYVVALNRWHNFIATWQKSSATLRIYVDAVEKNYTAIQPPFNVTSNYLGIGNDWSGYLAGARVYNKVLDASEISALSKEFTPTA